MIRVFKFGGASVKDSQSVMNVGSILKLFADEKIAVIISAMGKTTNAFEDLLKEYTKNGENKHSVLNGIKNYHYNIMDGLFNGKEHQVYKKIDNVFFSLENKLNSEPSDSYDYEYDQIVSLGEILSTLIVSEYLNSVGIKNKWVDVRKLIYTDNTYRDAKVIWEETAARIRKNITFKDTDLYIIQGFIGSTKEKLTTTLGREGSDYSAAIAAFSLDAKDVTIWKDVPGVLNADPKWFDDTVMLERITYHDAIELAYYGASVIHPKTIKPLQNKNIPLHVKSFLKPSDPGTVVSEKETYPKIPSFIFKVNQTLITVSPRDFSFIGEQNFSDIFSIFAEEKIKINMMQNTAISFSVSVDYDERKIPELIKKLENHFIVRYNTDGIELVTIRNYDQATIDRVCLEKEILLEEKSRHTVQLVVRKAK